MPNGESSYQLGDHKLYATETPYGRGQVRSYASILERNTLDQALMLSRHPLLELPVALMPDAHLGIGATVGSVLVTTGGLIPAAVGVDIGCGVIAAKTSLTMDGMSHAARRGLSGYLREFLPSGKGRGGGDSGAFERFAKGGTVRGELPASPMSERALKLRETASSQFGTLGSGNHFAEYASDETGRVWALVHSGSRGVGNQLAQHHIAVAKGYAKDHNLPLEDMDLAYLVEGTPEFHAYWRDMQWAQAYALAQRDRMMQTMLDGLRTMVTDAFDVQEYVNCHHNYSDFFYEWLGEGPIQFISRKGAIDASAGVMGVIPGSMGAATHIVKGRGNPQAYRSSPHGAGRVLSRGGAKRTLDLDEFKLQMEERGVVWQDRDAQALLDEAPGAYKPIEVVMKDAATLVETVAVLKQFVNFKGV